MLVYVTDARYLGGFRLWLSFNDGVSGEVDLENALQGPIFEPLREPSFFAKVRFDPELDTVTWPNGADFAPEFLRERLRPVSSDVAEPGVAQTTADRGAPSARLRVETAAMRLSTEDRAALASVLLRSLDDELEEGVSAAEVAAAWIQESERRDHEVEAGRSTEVPAEQVFEQARRLIR